MNTASYPPTNVAKEGNKVSIEGKDLKISSYRWIHETGLTEDQFANVWTYGTGESVPIASDYRNLTTGEVVSLNQDDVFPYGRYALTVDLPGGVASSST